MYFFNDHIASLKNRQGSAGEEEGKMILGRIQHLLIALREVLSFS